VEQGQAALPPRLPTHLDVLTRPPRQAGSGGVAACGVLYAALNIGSAAYGAGKRAAALGVEAEVEVSSRDKP